MTFQCKQTFPSYLMVLNTKIEQYFQKQIEEIKSNKSAISNIWFVETLVDCDFEHGITSGKCILKQLNDDQFDWTLKSGATGISGSGPTADYTTGAGKLQYDVI